MSSYNRYIDLLSPVPVESGESSEFPAVDILDRDLGIRVHRLRIDGSDPISLFAELLRKLRD